MARHHTNRSPARPLFEPLEPRVLLDGAFYGRASVPVGESPIGIVAGDFSGDGRTDLAVANYMDNDVSIVYGQAAGGFAGRRDVAVGRRPEWIVAADFNGDGRSDLAAPNWQDDDVSILYGQAGGSFGSRQDVAVGDEPWCIVTADFNGDGRPDVAVTNQSDNDVSVLYGQGGGGLAGRRDFPTGDHPRGIATGDFDGDGRPDLAVGNQDDGDVSILYGQADAGFDGRQDVPVGRSPEGITTGDLDGDGLLDLAVANSQDDDVSILYGQVGGGFDRHDVTVGNDPRGIISGDFNSDGHADLATPFYGNLGAGGVTLLHGLAGGGFARQDVPAGVGPEGIAAGDFNGDGRADLAVTNMNGHDVSILCGRAGGGFDGPVPREDVSVGMAPSGIVSGEFNGDDRVDLAVANYDHDDVSVLYGLPDGGFGNRKDVAVGDRPFCMVTSDLNRDGRADLAVANSSGPYAYTFYVSVLSGQAGGGFTRQNVTTGPGPQGVAAGDFNGDGRTDLASGNYGDNDVSLLYGQVGGGFGGRVDVAAGRGASCMVTGDFNRDGRDDLAVANYTDNDVSILYGLSGGGLGNRRDVAVGRHPRVIAAGDLNGDGRVDLAVANEDDRDVTVLYGQASGSFGNRRDVPTGAKPFGVVIADFDLDGRADLAVTSQTEGEINVLYGQAGGGFGDRQDLAVGSNPVFLVAADFDGDGRLDLAAVNRADNDVSVVYNRPYPPADNIPPTVVAARVEQASGNIALEFSEAVEIDKGDLVLVGCDDGELDLTEATLDHEPAGSTATLRFPTRPPADQYTLTVKGDGATDVNGNFLDGNGDGAGGDDYQKSFLLALTGDWDNSGCVDALDYIRLKRNCHMACDATWGDGDGDGDADVDRGDFLAMRARFGSALQVAPVLMSASVDDPAHVRVLFDRPLDAASAETVWNYSLLGPGGEEIPLAGAELQADGRTVVVQVAGALAGGDHVLTVANVTSLLGYPIAAGSSAAFHFAGEQSLSAWRTFDEIHGDTVPDESGNEREALLVDPAWTTDDILGGALLLYLDGEAQVLSHDSGPQPAVVDAATRVAIEVGQTGSRLRWDGLIDDVRIYNRALSDAEIELLAYVPQPA